MRRYIYPVFVLLFLFTGQVFACDSTMLEYIGIQKYDYVYSVDKIDKGLVKYLKKVKGYSLEMTNPNEEFNRFDVKIKGIPNKRLLFGAMGDKGIGFLLYETGAVGLYNTCLIFKQVGKRKYCVISLNLSSDVKNYDDIIIAIDGGQYSSYYW